MKSITQLILFTIWLISPLCLKGTHIIGGTATYTTLGIDDGMASVEIYFYLYRDGDSPAQFDDNIDIGIYGYTNGEYEFVAIENAPLFTFENLIFSDVGACNFGLFNYQAGLYGFRADIPLDDYEHFTFAYQRCCRGNSITNVLLPVETGIAISLDIYPIAFEQDSGQVFSFKNEFPVHVEPGKKTEFDVSVGGGSETKEYYLSTPKVAGGIMGSSEPGDPFDCKGIIPDPMNCLPDFDDVKYIDSLNPYGQGAVLELDKNSGVLSATVPLVSKILVAMTMKRFVDAQIVSELRQQFIMNSFVCTTSLEAPHSELNFAAFPNPVHDIIHFSSPLKNIEIYNLQGENHSPLSNNEWTQKVDFGHLPTGIYFIKAQSMNGRWVTSKVVKL